MKKIIWVLSVFILLISSIFTITTFLNSTDQDPKVQTDQKASHEEENSVEKKSEEETLEETPSPSEPKEEVHAGEQEGTLSEGLREVFTSVIESAKDLFLRDNLNIVAIGDSLTQGVGDETDNGGYIGILEKNFNNNNNSQTIEIANYGKRGNRTDQLLKRMESEEISSALTDANLILITIGANDVMKVVKNNFTDLNYQDFITAQEGYEERLNQIIQHARELNPDAPIYLVGLYNPFERYFNNIPELGQIMSDYNRISKDVIDGYDQAHFIPIKNIFTGNEEELLWDEDHFHPNKRGYKRMAERVLEYIRPEIEQ